MKISNSLLNTFEECPKKYFYSYKKGLYTDRYLSGLAFGKFFHSFSEARSKLETVDRTEFNQYIKDYPDEKDAITRDWCAACSAAESHLSFWSDPEIEFSDMQFETVAIEPWVTSSGKHLFRGKLDRVVKAGDEIILVEMKTSGVTDRNRMKQQWKSSPQSRRYLRLMESKGWNTLTVLWDIIWKPAIRMKQTENEALFTERLCNEYTENPDKYFERFIQHIDKEQVIEREEDDNHLLFMIETCEEIGHYPKNLNSCVGKYGACDFFGLCHEGMSEDVFNKKGGAYENSRDKI